METLTITVKSKKAKRILEDLAALNVIQIENNGSGKDLGQLPLIDPEKMDLEWLAVEKRPHAKKILRALRDTQLGMEGKIKLKSAKDLLNEL